MQERRQAGSEARGQAVSSWAYGGTPAERAVHVYLLEYHTPRLRAGMCSLQCKATCKTSAAGHANAGAAALVHASRHRVGTMLHAISFGGNIGTTNVVLCTTM